MILDYEVWPKSNTLHLYFIIDVGVYFFEFCWWCMLWLFACFFMFLLVAIFKIRFLETIFLYFGATVRPRRRFLLYRPFKSIDHLFYAERPWTLSFRPATPPFSRQMDAGSTPAGSS
jgi:hypothetical protein